MAEPNVLLLDEPTNDLDIDTAATRGLLDGWPGTMVVISRPLPDRADLRLGGALLGDGGLTNLPRGRRVPSSVGEWPGGRRPGKISRAASAPRPAARALQLPQSSTSASGEQRELQKEMNKLERQMQKLSQREEKLHADLRRRRRGVGH